jgi:hypothetical protein
MHIAGIRPHRRPLRRSPNSARRRTQSLVDLEQVPAQQFASASRFALCASCATHPRWHSGHSECGVVPTRPGSCINRASALASDKPDLLVSHGFNIFLNASLPGGDPQRDSAWTPRANTPLSNLRFLARPLNFNLLIKLR